MRLALLALVLLAGCASKIRVDYVSEPIGATLFQDGRPWGQTPTSLFYEPDQSFKSGGCMLLRGTSVKWVSGAEASVSSLTVCANNGWVQNYMFTRPDVPGREADYNYALQLQRNGIMKQQADAATVQTYQSLKPVRCRTYSLGGVIQTDCSR